MSTGTRPRLVLLLPPSSAASYCGSSVKHLLGVSASDHWLGCGCSLVT